MNVRFLRFRPRIAALAVACALVQSMSTSPAVAAPFSPEATTSCTPVGVGIFDLRIHVRCSAPVSGILYFAAPTSNNNRAARLLALLSTALAAGRNVDIFYDPNDTSGTAIGCAASDCRLIQAIEVR